MANCALSDLSRSLSSPVSGAKQCYESGEVVTRGHGGHSVFASLPLHGEIVANLPVEERPKRLAITAMPCRYFWDMIFWNPGWARSVM